MKINTLYGKKIIWDYILLLPRGKQKNSAAIFTFFWRQLQNCWTLDMLFIDILICKSHSSTKAQKREQKSENMTRLVL